MKILYVISGETGFKNTDEKILQSIGQVTKINFHYFSILKVLKYIFNSYSSEAIIIWFASKHAIPAALLQYVYKRNLIIIAGGYDVANVSSIRYGNMRKGYKRYIGQWILSKAKYVIAVSKSNFDEILNNALVHPNKVKLVYNAINLKVSNYKYQKINQVLTVGEINEETYLRKGLDRVIKLAKLMPDKNFLHIGKWTNKSGSVCTKTINRIKENSPSNLTFLGYLKRKELIDYYKNSKYYLQLSRHEAFGVSVIEAMSYGCIPIVSRAYALPEIVGENGYIVDSLSDITKIFESESNISAKYVNPKSLIKYSINRRKNSLEKIMKSSFQS